jgi:predicted transcriptional regulator
MGPNMKAFLMSIRSEPGVWTAPDLARDFGVSRSSARRTLRLLARRGLIIRVDGLSPEGGGRRPGHWYPVTDD